MMNQLITTHEELFRILKSHMQADPDPGAFTYVRFSFPLDVHYGLVPPEELTEEDEIYCVYVPEEDEDEGIVFELLAHVSKDVFCALPLLYEIIDYELGRCDVDLAEFLAREKIEVWQ